MLFSMEPGNGCTTEYGFVISPLPARKQLWEAPDETMWTLETCRNIKGSTVFGLMTDGIMIKLDRYQSTMDLEAILAQPARWAESSANWQEWCSSMDGLGTLIMLVATLPTNGQ
jgi:hypothetical protein